MWSSAEPISEVCLALSIAKTDLKGDATTLEDESVVDSSRFRLRVFAKDAPESIGCLMELDSTPT